MPVKHVGKAQQERESKNSESKAFIEMMGCIAVVALIVSCALHFIVP